MDPLRPGYISAACFKKLLFKTRIESESISKHENQVFDLTRMTHFALALVFLIYFRVLDVKIVLVCVLVPYKDERNERKQRMSCEQTNYV